MQQYNAIITLSFGKSPKVNKYLADITREIIKDHPEAKVILQKEVYEQMDFGVDENFHPITEEKYMDTIEVLKRAKKHLGNKNKIILVAHPLHFYRAWYIAENMGFKVSEGRVPKCVYDKNDPQIHCRNVIFFGIWNILGWIKLLLWKNE